MIAGIGLDLVSISRIKEKLNNDSFKKKVFSEKEILYCDSAAKPDQHYAVRFAAKEAFLKATGEGLTISFDLKLIEIAINEIGKPFIVLDGVFKELMIKHGWTSIHLSLSHEGDISSAIVIIEK